MSARDTRLADVRRLLKQAADLELSAGAVQRLKWFVYALEHDNNVSLACRRFGIARSTYMRWWLRFDASNPASLEEASRRPHTVRAPETDARTVELIRTLRMAHPAMGKVGIHALLRDLHGVEVSVSTVGRVIARNKLFFADSQAHARKRGDFAVETDLPSYQPLPAQDLSQDGTVPGAIALPPLPNS
jgi:hypothetical protein